MPIDAKTIQIYLPGGEPRGIRIAEITTRIVQAIQAPRARLDRIMERPEMDHIGIYFLFGESSEMAKPIAYIGQTEDLRGRLKKHHAEKEFWTTAVMLVSKTDSFTLAHIRYLEWYAIQQAAMAGRYTLDNGNAGGKPFVTEPMEADVLDAFETGSILLATLGFPLFDPVVGTGKSTVEQELLECSGPDAKGKGKLVEDGFVVMKGSLARKEITTSGIDVIAPRQNQLIAEGILVPNGRSLVFNQDYLFNTASGAAQIVLARRANGWMEWKTRDGRTLDEIARAKTDSQNSVE